MTFISQGRHGAHGPGSSCFRQAASCRHAGCPVATASCPGSGRGAVAGTVYFSLLGNGCPLSQPRYLAHRGDAPRGGQRRPLRGRVMLPSTGPGPGLQLELEAAGTGIAQPERCGAASAFKLLTVPLPARPERLFLAPQWAAAPGLDVLPRSPRRRPPGREKAASLAGSTGDSEIQFEQYCDPDSAVPCPEAR